MFLIYLMLGLEIPFPRIHIRVTMPRDSKLYAGGFAQAATFKEFDAYQRIVKVSSN